MTRPLVWALVPGLLLGLAIAAFLAAPLRSARPTGIPQVEQLSVEPVVLDNRGIAVLVRAGAGGPVTTRLTPLARAAVGLRGRSR